MPGHLARKRINPVFSLSLWGGLADNGFLKKQKISKRKRKDHLIETIRKNAVL